MTDQTHQIPSQLQTGRELGMQLIDQALLRRVAGQGDRSRTTPTPTRPTSGCSRNSSPTPACCRSSMPAPSRGRQPEADRAMAAIDEYLLGDPRAAAAPTCISSPAIRRASACYGDCSPLRREPLDGRVRHARRSTRSCRSRRVERFESQGRRRLRLHAGGRWALPRQRDAPAQRHGRRVPRDPVQGADAWRS